MARMKPGGGIEPDKDDWSSDYLNNRLKDKRLSDIEKRLTKIEKQLSKIEKLLSEVTDD